MDESAAVADPSGFAICHLPFAVCHLPFAICHLPFARALWNLESNNLEFRGPRPR
jgi:hypothetical protein